MINSRRMAVVTIYQSTPRYLLAEIDIHQYRCESLKYRYVAFTLEETQTNCRGLEITLAGLT
jgi:hypothetical protein